MAKRISHHSHATLQLAALSTRTPHIEWVPNTDVYETDSSFTVRIELGGVRGEDIRVGITDRTLIVRGCRHDPHRTKHCYFRQMEIHYGIFERRLALPKNVDIKHVQSKYQNGFLIVELSKLVPSKLTSHGSRVGMR